MVLIFLKTYLGIFYHFQTIVLHFLSFCSPKSGLFILEILQSSWRFSTIGDALNKRLDDAKQYFE